MQNITSFPFIEIPPKPNMKPPSIQIKITGIPTESITQEFIKFIKKESPLAIKYLE